MVVARRAALAALALVLSALGKAATASNEVSEEEEESESAAARTEVSETSPKEKHGIDWLHIPKTGTSFAYILLMYKCEHLENELMKEEAKSHDFWVENLQWMPRADPKAQCVSNWATPLCVQALTRGT